MSADLTPEPARDIRAQVDALLDRGHPKIAMFAAPGNEGDMPKRLPRNIVRVARAEGVLMTSDRARAAAFAEGPIDDDLMAWLLGYPESKTAAMAAGDARLLRVVQARDIEDNIITEALCSPCGLDRTREALAGHVPPGGYMAVTTPVEAIARRLDLRHRGL